MRKGERTREAILHTAARLFEEKGYFSTGIDDIARALHIAKGTMYQYFKDKQELYLVIVQEAIDYLVQQYDRVGAKAHSLQELLTGLIYETNLFNVKEYDFFKIHVSAGSSIINSGDETYAPMRALSVKMHQLIENYHADLCTESWKAVVAFSMVVNSCCVYLMEMMDIPREEITEEQVRIVAEEFATRFLEGYSKRG